MIFDEMKARLDMLRDREAQLQENLHTTQQQLQASLHTTQQQLQQSQQEIQALRTIVGNMVATRTWRLRDAYVRTVIEPRNRLVARVRAATDTVADVLIVLALAIPPLFVPFAAWRLYRRLRRG